MMRTTINQVPMDILYRLCENSAEVLEIIEATLDVMSEELTDINYHPEAERITKALKQVRKVQASIGIAA